MNVSPPALPALPAPRLFASAAVAAPLLFLVSDVAYVTAGDGVNDGVLGGAIGVWSCLAFVIAWIGISRTLEGVAPRGAFVLLVIGLLGFTSGAGFNVDAIQRGHYGESFFNGATIEGSDAVGVLAFLPWGWCAPLSFVVAGVLIWRTRAHPTWNAVLLVLGGLAFLAGRPVAIDPVVIVADTLLVLAVVPIGLTMLSPPARDDTARVAVGTPAQ